MGENNTFALKKAVLSAGVINKMTLELESIIDFFHKSFFDQYKSFESQNLKTNSRKYWIDECGMDATLIL
ncbi:hypothetical protein [Acinetobacter sp. ANC 4973]|uniref:hypothetical protein n=1 Tax=Acinetobacter sp. ANC 4973 TaxID=1977871 RepID=UPI000A33B881|nr:hypothetical protein [Acinetobacter sp. ANC 4973]OTH00693.1 hypothetical protein B9T30_01040 [Acinetobacter sp. ANC 4973]